MADTSEYAKKIAKDAEEWASKQKFLQMSEISIVLESYDSIFSDFDPRNYGFDKLTPLIKSLRKNFDIDERVTERASIKLVYIRSKKLPVFKKHKKY